MQFCYFFPSTYSILHLTVTNTPPIFSKSFSWIKMTWFIWKRMTSCWSHGSRWYRRMSTSPVAALFSQLCRSSTLTFSVTLQHLMEPETWLEHYIYPCIRLSINISIISRIFHWFGC